MGFFNFFTQEIAIDLGTANTLIIHNDKVVVDEPSIVAMDRKTGKVIAIGKSTEKKLNENGVENCVLPQSFDEVGLTEAVFGL